MTTRRDYESRRDAARQRVQWYDSKLTRCTEYNINSSSKGEKGGCEVRGCREGCVTTTQKFKTSKEDPQAHTAPHVKMRLIPLSCRPTQYSVLLSLVPPFLLPLF